MAELYGTVRNGTCKTGVEIIKTFTTSQSYVIPTGYIRVDLFAVGGGGGSSYGDRQSGEGCEGGAGGYTKTVKNVTVVAGQALYVVIGAGGTGGTKAGSTSLVSRGGANLITANGGDGATTVTTHCDGGSGGGSRGMNYTDWHPGGRGGENGSDGYCPNGKIGASKGQGTTTRAWGASNGTLYAGGGGGGSYSVYGGYAAGGAGGGGRGGYRGGRANSGTPNTGGGAGGNNYNQTYDESGGSGIILAKLY